MIYLKSVALQCNIFSKPIFVIGDSVWAKVFGVANNQDNFNEEDEI